MSKNRKKVGEFKELAVEDIIPNGKLKIRKDLGKLVALRQSIREQGLIEPLVVRPAKAPKDKYELVCGCRRLQAVSDIGGWKTVPAYIRTDLGNDFDALSVAAIENSEEVRTALDPMDRARLFRRFMDEDGATDKSVARRMACSKQTVRNGLKLLKLPPDVLKAAQEKKLSGFAMGELAGYDRDIQDAVMKKLKKADSADRIKCLVNEFLKEKGDSVTDTSKKPKRAVRWRRRKEVTAKFREVLTQYERERGPFVSGVLTSLLWYRAAIEETDESVVGSRNYAIAIEEVQATLRGKARGKK